MLRQEFDKTPVSHRGSVAYCPGAKNSGPVFVRRYLHTLHKLDEMPNLMRFLLTGALVTACLLPSLAQTQSLPLSGQFCIPEFNAGNRCTSNSLAFRAISVDPSVSRCEIGETLDLRIGVTVGTGVLRAAKDRYNLSFWVGENGNLAISDTGTCTVSALQPATSNESALNLLSGSGPYRLTNGDSCGDISDSEITYHEFVARDIVCQDTNGNGKLDIPFALAWQNNANQDICSDPLDTSTYYPKQSSHCREEKQYDLDVIIVEPAPQIDMVKVAVPRIVREPGDTVYFEVEVFNESNRSDDVVVTDLTDNIYGDLNGQGNCAVGASIPPGGAYRCEFSATVTGAAGDIHRNVATARVVDSSGQPVTDSDAAVVVILPADAARESSLRVVKESSVQSLPEPGGDVTYSVEVWNDGETDLVVTALSDDQVAGNDLNGLGTCFLPQSIPVGTAYRCEYHQVIDGRYPLPVVNTVTVEASAPSTGDTVSGSDSATVTLTDTPVNLDIRKLARPRILSQAGGDVTYRAVIENHSPIKSVSLTSLVDNYHGDVSTDCGMSMSSPVVLTPGAAIECDFVRAVPDASQPAPTEYPAFITDTVTVSGKADNGADVEESATEVVLLLPASEVLPPEIEVEKFASPDRLTDAGGEVTFTVEVINASASEAVLITSLVDDIHGDLSERGTCPAVTEPSPLSIAAGSIATCTFTETIQGAGGTSEVDTVTASGSGETTTEAVSAFDQAEVRFVATPIDITLTKTPSTRLTSPGARVAFAVAVTNNGPLPVSLAELQDSEYGDLNGKGSCVTPTTIATGADYRCDFSAAIASNIRPLVHFNQLIATANSVIGGSSRASGTAVAQDNAWVLLLVPSIEIPPVPVGMLWPLTALGIAGAVFLHRRRGRRKK